MPEPADEMDAYDRRMADLEQAEVVDEDDGDYTITFTMHDPTA